MHLYFNYAAVLLFALLYSFGSFAEERPEPKGVALNFVEYGGTHIGGAVFVKPSVSFRASFGMSHTDDRNYIGYVNDPSSDYFVKTRSYILTAGPRFYIYDLNPHLFLDVLGQYRHQERLARAQNFNSDEKYRAYTKSASVTMSVGGEYMFNPHFSLEAKMGVFVTYTAARGETTSDRWTFETYQTGFGANYYF